MKLLLVILGLAFTLSVFAQGGNKDGFTMVKEVPHTSVVSQGVTGTCWSFSTTSFLESEIMRKGFPEVNLSEMFNVYYNYKNKAFQYLLYHGHNNFGQGSLSHDVIDVVREHGFVNYRSFAGKKRDDGVYDHNALENKLKNNLDVLNNKKKGKLDISYLKGYNDILEKGIGIVPEIIIYKGDRLSPIQFRDKLEINPDDYVELTSYSHHPFYKKCVLEIPDNWKHALYYNLPIDELIEVMFHSLYQGYSLVWDGDISEKKFSQEKGVADIPKKEQGKVTQRMRQHTFYDRTTTDDHLMHIVGISKDSDGRSCFYIKNSWKPKNSTNGGYLHMTEDYARLKTVAIMVNKNAIPDDIKVKLGLEEAPNKISPETKKETTINPTKY